MRKLFLLFSIALFFLAAGLASAHQPELVYLQSGEVQIINPEVSRALYDELKGGPRYYLIDSAKDFDLYINLLDITLRVELG